MVCSYFLLFNFVCVYCRRSHWRGWLVGLTVPICKQISQRTILSPRTRHLKSSASLFSRVWSGHTVRTFLSQTKCQERNKQRYSYASLVNMLVRPTFSPSAGSVVSNIIPIGSTCLWSEKLVGEAEARNKRIFFPATNFASSLHLISLQ